MDRKSYERMRNIIQSGRIPKWAWGIGLIALIALVVLGIMIGASESSAASTNFPGNDIVSSTSMFINVVLKLGIVILMIYVFMQLLKRWQGTKQGKHKKYLSVIETTYLNPRQALHLVQAGDKLLLLGSTDQSVSCISELPSEILTPETIIAPNDTAPGNPNTINNFAALLAQSFNKH
ncbi:MAG: flagellar biosynthetic protein FliO [Anaerolineales bacterium]|nr:flagellar biosynthetic protein FliO [Anaerolineales bacterium]